MNEKEKELIEKTEWRVQVKGSINTAALNNGNVDAINNTTDNLIEFLEYKFDQAIRTAVEELEKKQLDERRKIVKREMKICNFCNMAKYINEFHTYISKSKGRRYEPNCRECHNIKNRVKKRRQYDRMKQRARHVKRKEMGLIKVDHQKYYSKEKSRQKLRYAVKKGYIEKKSCEICNEPKVEAHHYKGYDYPLDVKWLCIKHHKEAHYGTLEELENKMQALKGGKEKG